MPSTSPSSRAGGDPAPLVSPHPHCLIAVVREFLAHYADTRARRTAALDVPDALAAASRARSGTKGWARESLHDR